MSSAWKVVIVGGRFGGLSAAQSLKSDLVWAIQDLTFSRGDRLITGVAPTDFNFNQEISAMRSAPEVKSEPAST
jgi:hypothetical protein